MNKFFTIAVLAAALFAIASAEVASLGSQGALKLSSSSSSVAQKLAKLPTSNIGATGDVTCVAQAKSLGLPPALVSQLKMAGLFTLWYEPSHDLIGTTFFFISPQLIIPVGMLSMPATMFTMHT
jgi:hypothetical protein